MVPRFPATRVGRRRVHGWVLAGIVLLYLAVSLVLNLITPSPGERAIGAPAAFLLLVSSAVVAVGRFREREG